jgi:hypothetical protein
VKKEKMDAIEAAVDERRRAREHLAERSKELKAAKKQYDQAAECEEAAVKRLATADARLVKAVEASE